VAPLATSGLPGSVKLAWQVHVDETGDGGQVFPLRIHGCPARQRNFEQVVALVTSCPEAEALLLAAGSLNEALGDSLLLAKDDHVGDARSITLHDATFWNARERDSDDETRHETYYAAPTRVEIGGRVFDVTSAPQGSPLWT
jgi:hypothetical protein